jgi:hypothetical protein
MHPDVPLDDVVPTYLNAGLIEAGHAVKVVW